MNLLPEEQHREEPQINLTALIDVVFLLLIFFMVSTTFDRFSQLRVDLPRASADAEQPEPRGIEVVIDAAGNYFIGRQEMTAATADELVDAIARAAGDERNQLITIRADARTPHQAVVTAMDAAGQLGLTNLRIATVQPTDSQ